jgi:hypothetical protein
MAVPREKKAAYPSQGTLGVKSRPYTEEEIQPMDVRMAITWSARVCMDYTIPFSGLIDFGWWGRNGFAML